MGSKEHVESLHLLQGYILSHTVTYINENIAIMFPDSGINVATYLNVCSHEHRTS